MKKISLKFIMAITLFGLLSSCSANAKGNKGTKDFEATQIVEQMQFGWNLGNTLDAVGGSWARGLSTETAWGQPKTTKPMIDGLAKSGIKTIRIPISWHDHVIDKNYTIDPAWMARVKQIVDWAYENELFIIINTHHDNYDKNAPIPAGSGYYYPSQENYEESSNYLKALWAQICETFNNDYDYHLIFETMNEPRPCGTDYEWWHDPNSIFSKKFMGALNKLNQDVVDTIRKSGGNNKYRMIMVPALAASPDAATTMDFIMPKDTVENRKIHLDFVNENWKKYFKAFEIGKDDTLWKIAKEHIDYTYYDDINEYIEEVMCINHMKDDTIKYGQSIIIPYFETFELYYEIP